MKRVLVVDCNDSFVYNLKQLLLESNLCKYDIIKTEYIDLQHLKKYNHILLSPGPYLPRNYPILFKILKLTYKTHKILGVCLGLQTISEFFGCSLVQLPFPKHGHESVLFIKQNDNLLFKDIPNQCKIGRYHSWVVNPEKQAPEIEIIAFDEDKNIQAIKHKFLPIYGVQFHPESYMFKYGHKLINNWLSIY